MMKLEATRRAMKKSRKRSSCFLSSLPHDMLMELALQLATKSSTPFKDVRSLRATCKAFYRASNEKLVGYSIAVRKEDAMPWHETKANYMAMLQSCANCGNVEAMFILGAQGVYNSRDAALGLNYLRSAMDAGHLPSAYLRGVVLFRDADTRPDAMAILNKVSTGDLSCVDAGTVVPECRRSGNNVIHECRREVMDVIEKVWTKEWEVKEPRALRCQDPLCGRTVKAEPAEHWMEHDRQTRAFCSQLCRWSYESQIFHGQL